jgi:hypothetical protein
MRQRNLGCTAILAGTAGKRMFVSAWTKSDPFSVSFEPNAPGTRKMTKMRLSPQFCLPFRPEHQT